MVRKRTPRKGTTRGQAHTLEAVMAGVLLLGGLAFALQITAVTSLSASTSNEYVENQQGSMADGALAAAAQKGSLKQAVLLWNENSGQFFGSGEEGFYTSANPPPNDLVGLLERTFRPEAVAYNVYVTYRDGDITRRRVLFYQGEPSSNAMTAARTVTLYDSDLLQPSSTPITASKTYFISDRGVGNVLYNVVRVEVVVWRT